MTQTTPSVTVLVCTHRRPEGLRRLLDALVPQIEGRHGRDLVVVNDGSHDTSYDEAIEPFAGRMTYQVHPPIGVVAARNAAAAAAGGDYIVFTDDDCVPPRWWLDWLTEVLISAPDLDVVAGPTRPLWPARPGLLARAQAHFELLPRPVTGTGWILFATANVAIRRSLFERIGGFGYPGPSLGGGEDTDLASRLCLAGARIHVDPNWWVRHVTDDGLLLNVRRFWRYGFCNGRLRQLTTGSPINDRPVPPTPTDLFYPLYRFRVQFRTLGEYAADFEGTMASRLCARTIAAVLRAAYDLGYVSAVHRRWSGTLHPRAASAEITRAATRLMAADATRSKRVGVASRRRKEWSRGSQR